MKEKNKNRNDNLSEFIRYTRGEMTKREENSFQRKLQKDPFAGESDEGYSEISQRQAIDDLNSLEKRLKNRTRHGQRVVYYRIAASLAVIMIISSVFIYVERNKPERQFSDKKNKTAGLEEVNDSGTLNKSLLADSKKAMAAPELATELETADYSKEAAMPSKTANPVSAEKREVPAMVEKKDTNLYTAENKIAEQPAAVIVQNVAELNESDIKPDTQLPAPVKADEVGYGAMKSSRAATVAVYKAENINVLYNPPQPVNGQASFDNYIQHNIQKPVISVPGQTAEVVVSFIVRISGTIDSINVISSPGKEYSEESVRLIKDGPSWKPAERNNEKIDDKVRLKIVFK
jgi:hypothetical protein